MYQCTWNGIVPIFREHFPDLLPRYRALYRGRQNASRGYLDAVKRRFRRIAKKHGLESMKPFEVEVPNLQLEVEKQLRLL